LRNDPLQQDWVEIRRFHFRGSLFSAYFFFIFCAIFQHLVLAIFGAGAIFQLLVLAIFGDFSEDLLLALFSASGLSNFWCGCHFSAFGLSNFWQFFGVFVFATQRRFLPKLKVCPLSVSSTNPSAQNSKLENNASDNTSLLLMYRRYILLFYIQFSCAIARFIFSNISVSFCLAFSKYFLSSEDGLNNLSMSIGSTRYSSDSVRIRDKTTYSQFLNIVASPSVGQRIHQLYLLTFPAICVQLLHH
jgi:hypothetical protein